MKSQSKNILILFFTLIVVMLGFGMIIPIMPFYIKSFGAGGSALGSLMATYGAMQFLFAPLWGSLSDRYGRKPILMVGVLGNAIAQLLFGLSTELWMLFAARALSGILSSATFPTAMAYISDSTSHSERGGKMGIIGAAMGIGMVIGPGLGGSLARQSLSTPFFLASALSMLALLLVWAILPEPPHLAEIQHRKASLPKVAALWKALSGPIGLLFFTSFMLTFGLTNFESIFGLYAAERYGYDTVRVGLVLTVIGLVSALIQGLLTGPLTRRWGETAVIRGSLLSSAVAFILLTQAQSFPQVLLTVCYFVVSNAMLNPAVASLISKRTQEGQGITMGINNSFLSLGRIAGPLWAGIVFDVNINLPYLSGAVILLAGFFITIWRMKDEPLSQPASSEVLNQEPTH